MGATVTFDLSGIAKLRRIMDNLENKFTETQPLLLSIAATLRATTQQRFTTKKTPEGKLWSTPLVKSGNLRKWLDIDADASTAVVGSNLEYAAIHQFGGVIRPKNAKILAFSVGGKKVFAHKVKIKANPYLGISESDKEEIVATVKDYFEEEIHG